MGFRVLSKRLLLLSLVCCLPMLAGTRSIALAGGKSGSVPPAPKTGQFDAASIRIEQNLTDGDAEAVVLANGGDDGLVSLTVTSPGGQVVFSLLAHSPTGLGARELLMESPEPAIAKVLRAFPAGTYSFRGRTVTGEALVGKAVLTHEFLSAPNITSPLNGETGVPSGFVVVSWYPVPGAIGYFVEFEQVVGGAATATTVELPANATSFSPPPGWVVPGAACEVAVGSIGLKGNRSFAQVEFRTAP